MLLTQMCAISLPHYTVEAEKHSTKECSSGVRLSPKWDPEHSINFLNTFRSLSTHLPGLETCSPTLPVLAFVHPTLVHLHVYFLLLASEVLPSCLSIILCLRGCTSTSFLSHLQFWRGQRWRQAAKMTWEERNQLDLRRKWEDTTLVAFLALSFLLQCKEVWLETAQGPIQPELF